MNKLITLLAAFALVTLARADTPREKAEHRLQRAAEVLQQIMNAPDKGIPEEVVKNAKCIAVVTAAGPVGRHAAADVDWKLETEILSYSRAKGVFAGVSLDGAYVGPDAEAIRAVYGSNLTARKILTGKVRSPEAAQAFLAAVRDAEVKADRKS